MRSLSAVPIRLAQSLRSFDYIWRSLRRSRQGTIGLLIVIVHMFIAVASPYIVPYSHHDIDGKNRLAAPSVEHPFGTDSFGRDLFTRVLLGGRAAIGVALLAAAIAVLWGGLLGILLAFIGGRVDEVVMRLVDALLAIPGLLVVLLIVVALGTGFSVLILTLGYAYGVSTVRIARGAALGICSERFHHCGARAWRTQDQHRNAGIDPQPVGCASGRIRDAGLLGADRHQLAFLPRFRNCPANPGLGAYGFRESGLAGNLPLGNIIPNIRPQPA